MRFIKLLTVLPLVLLFATFPARAQGIFDSSAIKVFYEEREKAFYWQDGGGLTEDAKYFIGVLENSWRQGLNPASYHTPKIEELETKADQGSRARLEILLTDGFIRYVRDMSGMRVKASDMDLDPADWLQSFTVRQCIEFLSSGENIKSRLDGLVPKSQTYHALQEELVKLSQLPAEPYLDVLPISFGGAILKPAQRHKKIPDLRLRLGVQPQTTDAYLYDDRLAAAVIKFQQATGQVADGIIGQTTLKLLNRSNRDRMLQIIANLERLRWVDEKRPDRFVMVNIPAATLWAIEGQHVAFQMPVVVGRPGRATQPFIADITGVRFNPDWTVPPTIKREDILPKLREDPQYLADKGMELIWRTSAGRVTLDPRKVEWDTITNKDLAEVDMIQMPGAHNPLGSIRILMPNKYNIYLHDTNHPEFFDRTLRAQSSGCIRLKEPEKMAAFVMEGTPGWSDAKMQSLIAAGRTVDARIEKTIPVYILYYSAWADEHGRIIFGNDIYGLDKKLIENLAAIDGFTLPGHNGKARVSFASAK